MTSDALTIFAEHLGAAWGPLSNHLIAAARREISVLLGASPDQPWLAEILRKRPARQELHHDARHGFILLAHAEEEGLYRPPHDHGRAWVVYAVQHGEVEMRTFSRVDGRDGDDLVQRDSTILRAGDVQVYLPRDIHDTRCLSETAMFYRFTERDLTVEDQVERRVARYLAPRDAWTASGQ